MTTDAAKQLQECFDFAEEAGLRVITRQDRRKGVYVPVYIVYRLGTKEGKAFSASRLMKLLKKTPPTTRQAAEPPPPAAAPLPRRDLGVRRKQWWED